MGYISKPRVIVVLLGIISAAPVVLVRFLPVFDYPHWIYQANVLANFSEYSEWFNLQFAPIPNLGSTLFLWPLTLLFSAELAGRVLVAIYASFVVITFYYVTRSFSKNSGLAFFGPILVFNYFFFNGFLSFFVGLPLLLLAIGVFARTDRITISRWMVLTFLSTLAYLTHLFVWLPLLIYVIVLAALTFLANKRSTAVGFGSTQIVPLALLAVYAVERNSAEVVKWSFYQSILNKSFSIVGPILPFSRTDPLPSVLPIIPLNLSFVAVMLLIVFIAMRHFKKDKDERSQALVISALILIGLAILIPIDWFGGMGAVDQRFSFLGFVLLTVWLGIYVPNRFKLFLGVTAITVLVLQGLNFVNNGNYLPSWE